MDVLQVAVPRRSLAHLPTRRGLLAGLAGGLFAAHPFALLVEEIEAKKHGKRKNKKRKKKAKVRVDATCGGPPESGLGSSDGASRLAQTFTASASGALVQAQVFIFKLEGSAGEYLLRVSPVDGSGVPTNDVLAETSVSNLGVPAGETLTTFTFANPPPVVAGTTYALILTRPGSSNLGWKGHSGDTCSGRGFVSVDQTAPFAEGIAGLDLIFTTFVRS